MIAEKPGATAQKLAPPLMGRMVVFLVDLLTDSLDKLEFQK
jgi:hypothetical protein